VVIDQTFAEQAFPGQDPIGKRLFMEPFDEGEGASWFQIVGVVARMKFHGFDNTAPLPNAYFSLDQVKRTTQVLFVRAGSQAKSLEKTVREIVASIDPAQPVFDVRTMQERVEETWTTHRLPVFCLRFLRRSRSCRDDRLVWRNRAHLVAAFARDRGAARARRATLQIQTLILSHGGGCS
jgi:hypothetical protein